MLPADLNAQFDAALMADTPLAAVSRAAGDWPHQPAIGDKRRTLSFGELRAAILGLAATLAGRGVRQGDRVIIAAENTVACVGLLYAVQVLGAWPAIMNPRIARGEAAALRACCAPRLVVFAVDDAPAALELSAADSVDRVVSAHVGSLLFSPTLEAKAEPVAAACTDRVALLVFTSGTLGTPKAVMLSHAALANLGRVLAESRRTAAGDVVQGIAPLSHIMGVSNLMSAMHAGATLQLMPRLEMAELAAGIAGGAITHLSFVPTVYAKLVDHLETHAIALTGSRLCYISCGGAPLDPALKRRVERVFGLRLVNGYGLTECAPGLRTRPDVDLPSDCVGWPERGVEVRIEGADDAEGIGELWLRSATMMLGYYGDEAQTAAVLRPGGWLATGDLARHCADGSIAVVGRRKEMIIRSGFNVYPAEVEAALNEIPQVLQCGVVGAKAAVGEEEIVAFIQLRSGAALDASQVHVALRDKVAPYKRPTRIVFVAALPLGPTGKILKTRLVRMAEEQRGRGLTADRP